VGTRDKTELHNKIKKIKQKMEEVDRKNRRKKKKSRHLTEAHFQLKFMASVLCIYVKGIAQGPKTNIHCSFLINFTK